MAVLLWRDLHISLLILELAKLDVLFFYHNLLIVWGKLSQRRVLLRLELVYWLLA